MNLSNEKNTLLNTVSRLAVADGARVLGKYVTRGAMLAAALTVGTVVVMDSRPAIASCSDSNFDANADNDLGGANGGGGVEVICSDTVAGGYDADGYDNIDVRVIGDGAANPATGVAIDFGAGTGGNTNGGSITVEDTFIGGATNPGQVISTDSDAIVITGDNNTVNNGLEDEEGPDEVGGGLIQGAEDGIDIDGKNNVVHNLNNGYGKNSGVITGGGGAGDDGIEVSGGTSGNANVINNGLDSDGDGKTAYIISGGTPGSTNVNGDDGIDADGWTTVNNGKMGEIHGEDRGIEFSGASGDTLTIDNDGKIIGDQEDGIVIQSDGVVVNYSGAGTVSGGREVGGSDGSGIDIGSSYDNVKVTVSFDKGGLIEGYAHGAEIGPDSNNNVLTIKGEGTVEGDGNAGSDGVHVFDDSTGNKITIDDGVLVQGKDDGVDMGSGNELLVDGKSTVKGDTDGTGGGDGIQGNDDNIVHVTGESKVYGDPGILMDDDNKITVDGGAEVNADPGDGINVDDDNTILIGGAGGAGYVKATNGGDGIALTDEFNGPSDTNGNSVTIGNGGQVLVSGSGNGNGIVVGNVGSSNEDNSVVIESGGLVKVTNADGHGIVVNGQDDEADNNTVTIEDGGVVEASGDGVRLLGDEYVSTGLGAFNGGGDSLLFSDGDGNDNDLTNAGIIRAAHNGVLVSNTNSDVDNSGGEIYAGGDGVRFTTLHTDLVDGDTAAPGESESGYQSDEDSVIVAGRDGIHYDNFDEENGNIDANHVNGTGGDVNGLGEIDENYLIFKIKGNYLEVVENEGIIEAQRHGIRVNDNFDVTNGDDAIIVAGGLDGKGSSGGDGIHADANNTITNNGIIATGVDAGGPGGGANGIEVTGESNTIRNEGTIDTRGDTVIDEINNTTYELGAADAQDNGSGGDGIHATVDGLSLKGYAKDGYDQQSIYNGNIIIAADDGIDVKSGGFGPGLEQLIDNDAEGSITANDDGIVAENYNIIWNEGTINADDDGEDGGDGINVGHSNVVTNDGDINSKGGNGIVMDGQKGPFSFGNEVYNNAGANIVAGEDGIQVNGEQNYIENAGNIKGGTNGVALNDEENDFVSTGGTIEGGTGAGIYSNEDNDIELSGTTFVTSTFGLGGDGIVLEDDNSLEIEDGVKVHGDNDGIVLEGDDNDVDYEGDGVNGVAELKGRTGDALRIEGDSNTFDSSDDLDLQGGDDGLHISGNTNSVDIDGNVGGEDDGIYLDTATGNVITVGGDVTGDTDASGSGDGIDIDGGGSNNITVTGAISGDPGVIITNSDLNKVSGASITGTDGGVIIDNGNSNVVKATSGSIAGGSGDGVGITGSSNVVTASQNISGSDGVNIDGTGNQVSAGASYGITGTWDGVSIDGNGNNVKAGTGGITGNKAEGVQIDGNSNDVSTTGSITSNWTGGSGDAGVEITGKNNIVTADGHIYAKEGTGVVIDGSGNTVEADEYIWGLGGSGADITGNNNSVSSSGNIQGDDGDGASIDGNNNSVSTDAWISGEGDEGVDIDGNSNTVDAGGIYGNWDGADINGNNNVITVGSDGIEGEFGQGVDIFGLNNQIVTDGVILGGTDGVYIEGQNNNVSALGGIVGEDGDGVGIDGNNNVVTSANGISGSEDGIGIDGNTNTVTVSSGSVTGTGGDGVDIFGLGNNILVENGGITGDDTGVFVVGANNSVVAFGDIKGTDGNGVTIEGINNVVAAADGGDISGDEVGVLIDGDNNQVSADEIEGLEGNGVTIEGNSNTVDADGTISGTAGGVQVTGNQNDITAGDVVSSGTGPGPVFGIGVKGDQNTVEIDEGVTVTNGVVGVGLTGDQNTVVVGGTISNTGGAGMGGLGVYIGGDQNSLTADAVVARTVGVLLQGDDNNVDIGSSITAGFHGVWFDSGTGNNVDLRGVTVNAGGDGVHVDEPGNTFQHDASTTINAGDDGVEFEYGGLVNAYEQLVWKGTINAKDDGIVLGGNFFTVINQGTINADTDKNSDGNGITAQSDNTIQNSGTITGWNGIVADDRNNITNDAGKNITVDNDGIVVDDDNKVINNGTITAGDDGIVAGDKNYIENNSSMTINAKDNGIEVGSNNEVVNNGVINADSDDNNDGDGINALDSNEITNDGEIEGWNGIVVRDGNTVTNNDLVDAENIGIDADDENVIENTGSVLGQNIGVDMDQENDLTNDGYIFGQNIGVNAYAYNTIDNNDEINSYGDGVVAYWDNTITNDGEISGSNEGVELTGNYNDLDNNGYIYGGDTGVAISGSENNVTNDGSIYGDDYDGVAVWAGSYNNIYNNDYIQGEDDGVDVDSANNDVYNYAGGYILGLEGSGVELSGGNNYVYNNGTIDGEGDDGIDANGNANYMVNYATIEGADDGVSIEGDSNTLISYSGSITGETDDGVDIEGSNNVVYNYADITGADEGIEDDGYNTTVVNGSGEDDSANIIGKGGDGIDSTGNSLGVWNYGLIQGEWGGIDHSGDDLEVTNVGGSIVGLNANGIETDEEATISNSSEYSGGVLVDQGSIYGEDDGINAGEGLALSNYTDSLIEGNYGDGVEFEGHATINNWGRIQGALASDEEAEVLAAGIRQTDGYGETTIYNGSTGVIVGTEAGYIYDSGSYDNETTVTIENYGLIEAVGNGVLPEAEEDGEDAAVNLDLINGKNADPVAAIDTSNGGPGLETFVFNYGEIWGMNEFSPEIPAVEDDPETDDVDETKAAVPAQQLTNRFAILGGEGNEYIANFAGGVINGDIATQGGSDVLAMEIGSTLNGDVDLGQTLETSQVLGFLPIADDPETEEDESKGGTAIGTDVGFVTKADVDTDVDTVILFGEGYQQYSGDITEAEVLYVNDQITEDDIRNGTEDFETASVPVQENQPFPVGTWSLNGNVTVDGTNKWTSVQIDGNGNGVLDEESSTGDETVWYISGTVGTVVDNGRLNVGATEPVTFQTTGDLITQAADGTVTDDTKGDGVNDFVIDGDDKSDVLYDKVKLDIMSTAVLTSPVVDVLSGGTLGGHGTIVTNPGANGGNGGVNLSGAVQGETTTTLGVNEANLYTVVTPSEARGSLIIGTATGDLVTQDEDGKVIDATKGDDIADFKFVPAEDEEDPDVKVDLLYTVDAAGKLYPTITLPAGWVSETGPAAFDFTTDSPRYATLAPGDEINRIGTLTVYGNVKMDGRETKDTTFQVKVAVDAVTQDEEGVVTDSTKGDGKQDTDAEGDLVYKIEDQKGRTVVTNWGSQFQADLKDDGKGDLLLVKKTGVTTAFTGATFDTVGKGPVDLVTQDEEGTITDNEAGDGVNDYILVPGEEEDDPLVKQDIIENGAGGPDGIADGVSYKVSTVLDGHVSVDGRLDIRLDGEFVDLVDNSQPAMIDDPEGPTGCGDDPDGADSCPQVPNPLYAIPDGIADVDDKGIAKNNADFTNKALVWDIIIAEGGTAASPSVTGQFKDVGFDGGPNDGAVVVRYDDPDTAEDEELRVQLLKAYLQYLPDRVRIISIPEFGSLPDLDLTLNQQQTADYLDTLSKYGLQTDSLQGVLAIVGTSSSIPAALDALHPEWYNAFNEVGFSIARGAEHQAYIRTIEAQGFSGGQQNRVVMNVGDDSAVGSSASDKRATFWLAGSWGNAKVDDGSNEGWLEYKYETLTGYAGFDYLINPNLLLGILGGFGNTDVDARNGSGNEGDVDSWQVGGYISYFTNSWFLNAGGGIGDMNIESIRNINFGSGLGSISQVANAKYDGDITYFYGKGGYSFDLGDSGWKLSPELALSYVKVKQNGFSETGTAQTPMPLGTVDTTDILLDVERQSVESLRGTAQLRLSKTFLAGNGGGWMPYVRVGVANEFEDNLRPIVSGFQGAPGTSFTVFGKVPRETTVIFGAGISGKVSESFSLYLDYSGEMGGSFSEHVVSGGVRLHF